MPEVLATLQWPNSRRNKKIRGKVKNIKTAIGFLLGLAIGAQGFSQAMYDTLPNQPEHYAQRLEKFRKEPVTTGKLLFLGNSLTEGGNWRKLLKDSTVVNRGIVGDNTYGVLNRLEEVTRHKPSRVFLLIGVNDLSKNVPTAVILENIFSIVSRIHTASPKTKIFVQSLLPVNTTHKNFTSSYSKQESIVELNGQLKRYSEALKYTFVDIHNHFLDKQNMLDLAFTYDGLHLNAAGYGHWINYLKKSKYL